MLFGASIIAKRCRSWWLIAAPFHLLLSVPAFAQAPSDAPASGASAAAETLNKITSKQPDARVGDISLVTRNRDLVELGQELSRIYLTLNNSKRLSVTQIETKERTIEGALRSDRLYFGKG